MRRAGATSGWAGSRSSASRNRTGASSGSDMPRRASSPSAARPTSPKLLNSRVAARVIAKWSVCANHSFLAVGSPNHCVNNGSSAPRSSIVSLTSKITARFMISSGTKVAPRENDETGDRGQGTDDRQCDQVRRPGLSGDERLGGIVILEEREELDRL